MLQHRSVYLHCDVYLVGSLNLDTHVFKSLKFHNIRSFFFIAKTLGSGFYSLTNHFIAYCFVPLFFHIKKMFLVCYHTVSFLTLSTVFEYLFLKFLFLFQLVHIQCYISFRCTVVIQQLHTSPCAQHNRCIP